MKPHFFAFDGERRLSKYLMFFLAIFFAAAMLAAMTLVTPIFTPRRRHFFAAIRRLAFPRALRLRHASFVVSFQITPAISPPFQPRFHIFAAITDTPANISPFSPAEAMRRHAFSTPSRAAFRLPDLRRR
jgi:hypothetical protein